MAENWRVFVLVHTLFNLLFELSNEDRLNILLHLREKPQRLSQVARQLNFTRQETSRNFGRLTNAQLIRKESDELYHLTAYGGQVLKLLPSFEFLTTHVDYFTNHTLSRLPHEFFARIGDLVHCTYMDDVLTTLYRSRSLMRQSKRYLNILSNQYMMSAIPLIIDALERKVRVRVILPYDLPLPPGYFEQDSVQIFLKMYQPAKKAGLYEFRRLKRVDTCIIVSDPQGGRIFFPTLHGDFDYKGFTVVDERAHLFCMDLFSYYWNKAETYLG